MLFNSIEFLFVFLPVSFIFFLVTSRFRSPHIPIYWLVACSLYFYAYWDLPYLTLLCFSIGVNYLVGKKLSENSTYVVLCCGVIFNLSLIITFKYMAFFIASINELFSFVIPIPQMVLPLAISFFTFQQIAYLVDVYRGESKNTNFIKYIFFVSFFPQLIAGPIVRHNQIMSQLETPRRFIFNSSDLAAGALIFIIGLQKKLFFADGMAIYADNLFINISSQNPALVESWVGVLAYSFQIYFDFSAYTDMAIGLARVFGIRLPNNFESPYKATSIIDFWRRWHITLSRFLKDYLYIPLGGSRRGYPRRLINIMITMVLGGLWHGASWTFMFWGLLHGFFLLVNHIWRSVRKLVLEQPQRSTYVGRLISRILTLICITFAWVFFRANSWSDAINVISGMIGLNGIGSLRIQKYQVNDISASGVDFFSTLSNVLFSYQEIFLVLLVLGIIVLVCPNTRQILDLFYGKKELISRPIKHSFYLAACFLGVVGLLVVLVKGSKSNDFIYMVF